jgi:hypothetical protein
MRMTLIALLLAVCCLPGLAQQETKKLPTVDFTQDTLSLPPAYFPELPTQLRAWLEQRSYRIPQVHDLYIEQFTEGFQKHDRYNVVAGNFDGQGEQDWVFATFRDDTLKAFACWNADTSSTEQLDIHEFDRYQDGYTSIGYNGISALSFVATLTLVQSDWLNEDISSNLNNIYGDSTELPTVFKHDGLIVASGGDMWVGFIRYFINGQWIRFYHQEAEYKAPRSPL